VQQTSHLRCAVDLAAQRSVDNSLLHVDHYARSASLRRTSAGAANRATKEGSDQDFRETEGSSRGRRPPARVEDLVDRFLAGDSVAEIATDFSVPPDEVEDVIRLEIFDRAPPADARDLLYKSEQICSAEQSAGAGSGSRRRRCEPRQPDRPFRPSPALVLLLLDPRIEVQIAITDSSIHT
jgi:hypothetical protein